MKPIPTPIIAAVLFVVTFAGTIAVYLHSGGVPAALLGMDTLFAGAAIGSSAPVIGGVAAKDPPDAAP